MLQTQLAFARQSILDVLGQCRPDLVEFGGQTLDRVSPPDWTLEWYLPLWLGRRFELTPAQERQLVLNSAWGLISVRLSDDLQDGELPERAASLARRLGPFCYDQAVAGYHSLFDQDSPFWNLFHLYLARWRASAADQAGPELTIDPANPASARGLADRGAPLKIAAAAACFLAGRGDAVPPIEALLNDILLALVLYDHAADWTQDLAAGRTNAFVACLSPGPQTPDQSETRRSQVLGKLFLGDASRAYFDSISALISSARTCSRELGLADLAFYLDDLQEEVSAFHSSWADGYAARRREATAQLFGPAYRDALAREGRKEE